MDRTPPLITTCATNLSLSAGASCTALLPDLRPQVIATDIVGPQSFGADAAEQFFREQGLDMRRLVLERQSRNTHENAVFTKALVEPRAGETWLLVTSAFHMPRSMGVFRKVGWDVTPWPVDYRTEGGVELQQLFVNPADGVYRFEIAVKEWVGMLVYRSTGRSDALFPAPAR